MSDGTKIEWTDATANVVNGCSVVSPGCTNCYAMRLAGTRMKSHPTRAGLTMPSKAGPVWTGEVRFNEAALMQVLSWRRPRRIFWNAHGDLFHDNVPDAWIDRCFAVMALTPQHSHQVLTKRAARMREYFAGVGGTTADRSQAVQAQIEHLNGSIDLVCPLQNVWLGVSVEDQARADERIPDLLATPAAVRWISAEPLLGPVDLRNLSTMTYRRAECLDALTGQISGLFGDPRGYLKEHIDWVVAGGESGPGARPMHPDWARSLRDQCAAAGVAFHFKQWGEWAPRDVLNATEFNLRDWEAISPDQGTAGPFYRFGKRAAGRLLDGVLHDGYPA